MKKFNFILLLILCVLFSCKKSEEKIPDLKSEDISKTIQKMTELMVHDVTNPPLAARFFSYACLAGHEVVAQNEPGFKSMHGVSNGSELPLILPLWLFHLYVSTYCLVDISARWPSTVILR